MSKDYHHLTQDQRCQLYTLLNRGDSKFTIARLLGVHRSTIYREIIRNKGRRGYRVLLHRGRDCVLKRLL